MMTTQYRLAAYNKCYMVDYIEADSFQELLAAARALRLCYPEAVLDGYNVSGAGIGETGLSDAETYALRGI